MKILVKQGFQDFSFQMIMAFEIISIKTSVFVCMVTEIMYYLHVSCVT